MLETGIPNLDLILGGGIPGGDLLLVVGPAGSGKTTLTLQMAFHTAAAGKPVLFASTLSEPPNRLIAHVRSFCFYDEALVGKRVFFLALYPLVRQGLTEAADALVAAVKEHGATLLVLDGLMTLRDLHPGAPELRTFVYDLGGTLATLDCTTVITTSAAPHGKEEPFPELTMSDGIVMLGTEEINGGTTRTLYVSKLRGLAPLLGRHSLSISDRGVTVFPRFETVVASASEARTAPPAGRVPLGRPELDEMMGGGPTGGSCTVLAGAMGTGKTLTCLSFLMEGIRRAEKAVWLGFRETPEQLIEKGRVFGLDLQGAAASGLLTLLHHPPIDLDADRVLWELWQEVERNTPRRLAVDSVSELDHSLGRERSRRGGLAALVNTLQRRGVTSMMVHETPQVIGPELDFTDTPAAVLVENLILLRNVEFRGKLRRILSVLKMRDSRYDPTIREYTIHEQGLEVLSQIESGEGILTGIARLPSEARVKR